MLQKKSASREHGWRFDILVTRDLSLRAARYEVGLRLFTILPTSWRCSFSFAVVTQ